MGDLHYRRATPDDIAGMAEVRAGDWGTAERWRETMRLYLAGEHHPRHALPQRIAFVGADGERIAALVAGHLTRRFGCDGELEWISVRPEYRRDGVATQLLGRLAEWFVCQGARRICVDVQPANKSARAFYARHGATELNPHWLVWEEIGKLCE
jgi:GNAT superfamily N-acetyltransferase